MKDEITNILFSKGVNFKLNDVVRIKLLPTFLHISPARRLGIFSAMGTEIGYPLGSEVFEYMEIPFQYRIPINEKMPSAYNRLTKPTIEQVDIERGKFKIKKDDTKEYDMQKYYADVAESSIIPDYDISNFTGKIVRFKGYKETNTEEISNKIVDALYSKEIISGHYGMDDLAKDMSDIIVKIVNQYDIYLYINIKLLIHV